MSRLVLLLLGVCAASAPGSAWAQAPSPKILPGTRASAFAEITGHAVNTANAPLPNTPVRLRNARTGRAVESRLTDQAGFFAFRSLDPGMYVVELLSPTQNQTVLAASQLLSVNAGDTTSTTVKLPFKIPALSGLLGHSTPQATVIAAAAAASGVLATEVTGAVASARQ
jgi:hypothetical protein